MCSGSNASIIRNARWPRRSIANLVTPGQACTTNCETNQLLFGVLEAMNGKADELDWIVSSSIRGLPLAVWYDTTSASTSDAYL